jgi:TrmH family RNA methyltransferase
MPPFAHLPAAKVRLIRDLLTDKKTRDKERTFVIEGAKPIQELLDANAATLQAVVVTESWLKKNDQHGRERLEQSQAPVYVCRDSVFERLSGVRTPSGILALVRCPLWNQEAIFQQPQMFGLYGDRLQDPANVGTIIRTAAGFGLDALWLSSDSVDVFNPKIVRATAGGILTLPVFYITDVGLFGQRDCTLLAAEPPGSDTRALQDITGLPTRAILALGNESRGLSEATRRQASLCFHIPVSHNIESLNLGASAAIAMFYFSGLPREDK